MAAGGSGGIAASLEVDPGTGKISGEAVQVVDRIGTDDITAAGVFSVSSSGMLLYQMGSGATGDRHDWVDASGKEISQLSNPGVYGVSRLSPDGTRLATPDVGQGGSQSLWVWDLAGGAHARLSANTGADYPAWSADGRTLYFGTAQGPHMAVGVVPADGSEAERVLITNQNQLIPVECTGDGKWLLYEEMTAENPQRAALKAYPLAPGLQPFTVLEEVTAYSNARLKPSSNDWLGYQSNESGRWEVYLTRYPHPGAKYQVSQTGATQPVWSKDGNTLYYLDNEQRMAAVSIQAGQDSVRIGAPRTLFQTGVRNSITSGGYDVTRDGKFLIVNSVFESTAPVVLVTNWEKELAK